MFLNPFGAQEVDPEKLDNATKQFLSMQRTFNGILDTCMKKCVLLNHGDSGDLSKGEQVCIDRCVSKLFTTHLMVHEKLRGNGFSAGDTLNRLQPRLVEEGDTLAVTNVEMQLLKEGRTRR